ncbi:hypothetical protein Golob_022851 [Gossypium lobatum]|uniref:Uncharacterized protein n=1 Tax=Gossypium lobatum TaxID=34289 RepID=A0A7J8LHR3_9ROSI|nr:hypothetical protein [Gossypium lobatum]
MGRGMNTNITLPHGTYFSYVLRRLGISIHGDTPVSSNQPISYGALHQAGYHFDATSNTWMKYDQPGENKDDDVDAAIDDISDLNPIPRPPSSSHGRCQLSSLDLGDANGISISLFPFDTLFLSSS